VHRTSRSVSALHGDHLCETLTLGLSFNEGSLPTGQTSSESYLADPLRPSHTSTGTGTSIHHGCAASRGYVGSLQVRGDWDRYGHHRL